MIYLSVSDAAKLENSSERTVRRKAQSGKYKVQEISGNKGRGGKSYEILLTSLSLEAQQRYWAKKEGGAARVDVVSKDACNLVDGKKVRDNLARERIIQKALNVPDRYTVREWVDIVANENELSPRTLFRWLGRYKNLHAVDIAVRKERADKGQVRKWDDEAIRQFASYYINKRRKSVLAIWQDLVKEGYNVGSWRSAYRVKKSLGVVAEKYREKGMRGLEDEILPPILRDYTDLRINQIWVGDQHVFDWFVMDENSGAVFRPMCYMWQDIRSRAITGFSMQRQYDAFSIALALRDGILPKMERKVFGKPEMVYTDWGKPETSKLLNGFSAARVKVEAISDDFDEWLKSQFGDEINGLYEDMDIKARKAIVRNSKAKLIERTFNTVEGMLKDMNLPGWAGNKVGSLMDPDKEELKRLKKSGLMTVREFFQHTETMMKKYNNRDHRGHGMLGMSPNDIWDMEISRGWKPTTIDKKSADILFLKPARRKVEKRGIRIENVWYHDFDLMIDLIGDWVEVRYDPYRMNHVIVLHHGRFVCDAPQYAYGSMINDDLTKQLIAAKRAKAKDMRQRIRELGGHTEDYEASEIAKKAVTRFDHPAKEREENKRPVKKEIKISENDVWKILAEANRGIIFDHN